MISDKFFENILKILPVKKECEHRDLFLWHVTDYTETYRCLNCGKYITTELPE
jgi:DNA-directed RNA polymerase subunit N (RpoN/RPB10)